MTIVVFLDRKTTTAESEALMTRIQNTENVTEVKFNSKESVRKEMQQESDVFNSIMSQYTEETNPLQDTFLVKVNDLTTIGETADEIKNMGNVDIVKYGEGSVEELVKIFAIVKKITYVVVVALIIVTALLISNTIKITIQSRKREIEIRRLVGASNTFIRQPFFFEGIILGCIGSILPIAVCCYGYYYIYNRLDGQLFTAIIKLVKPSQVIYLVLIILLSVGVLVGAYGSYRAVRKYLKI